MGITTDLRDILSKNSAYYKCICGNATFVLKPDDTAMCTHCGTAYDIDIYTDKLTIAKQ